MKKIGMLITVIMLIAISTIAQADVKAGSFTITPFAGVYTFEGNEGINGATLTKQAWTGGLRAGYNFTEHIGVEGFATYVPAEVKDMQVTMELISMDTVSKAFIILCPRAALFRFWLLVRENCIMMYPPGQTT